MKKFLFLLATLVGLTIPAFASAPLGFVTLSASHVQDSTGAPLANGTITFTPTNNNGSPVSYRVNGNGQAISSPVSTLVTNGVFSIQLADTSQTAPANICYAVTIRNNANGKQILGPGYSCVQPSGSGPAVTGGNAFCTAAGVGLGGSCNFDNFSPNMAPLVTIQTGPVGPPNSLTIGTITPLPNNTAPTAVITGSAPRQTLNLGLVAGPPGGSLSYPGVISDDENGIAVTGKVSSSAVSSNTVNNVFNASAFPGSDCGAKIVAALTSSSGLNGQPGTVQVNNACGMAWTTAVTVGTNQSLQLTQAGVYTVTQPITLGQEASLSAATPRGSSNFSAYTLQAAAGAGLTNLLTMDEGSTVADINLDGNQANGGMTGLSSAVLTTVTNGGQKIKDTFAINSSGIGFSITQENVDISHSFAQFNEGQGLLCTDTADLWISGESQFESNGLSGIELNGCGSVRVVHADVSGNGSSGVAGTTGCSIYIHGTVAHISNTNIFTEVQSGNDFFEDVCDIGFDPVGGNFGNASNTFIGYQSLGSPNRTANTVPAILAQDMNGDQFIGGTLLPGPHAASFGIEFTETSSGRANASTVIGVDFNTGFGTANYISSTANQNYFNGNVEGLTGFSQMGPHAYIVNGGCLYFDNTSADPECTLFADIGNNMNIVDAGGGAINMSTQTGAGIAEFSAANSTIQGNISNSHTVLIPSGTTTPLAATSTGQVAGQVACIKAIATSTTAAIIGTCSGTVNATTGVCGTCN